MWDFIWTVLSEPIRQWNGVDCTNAVDYYCYPVEPDRFLAVFIGVLIYGITAVILGLAAFALYSMLNWAHGRYVFARDAQPCQHADCGHQQTLDQGAGEPGCTRGEPCCGNCRERHRKDGVKRGADKEAKRECMHGHGPMEKHILRDEIVIDQCATCNSVWLDTDEIDKIKQWAHDEGYSAGQANSSSSSNLALGIAMGAAMGAAT